MKVSIPAACNWIRRGLIAWSFLLSLCCSYGQYENITFQFDRILFHDFADTVERIIPVRFYYSDKWTDTLYLSVNSSNSTFDGLMNKSLRKYGFSFIITDDNKVILSKGYSIKTNFREEYLDRLKRDLVKVDTLDYLQPAALEEKSLISDEYRLFKIGRQVSGKNGGSAILSGNIINSADGRYVSGAIVYIEKLKIGVITNDAGHYLITLPPGQYQIDFRMIGMKTARRNVMIYSSGVLDVDMDESTSELGAVEVTGSRSNVKDVSTGIEKINARMLKQIPMGLGEADVLKSSLLLPGVQTVGEASAGFNVRGGSIDQNLIVLNKAPILNPSHLFGFFSAFNSDLIANVILYKSGMPAKYGGRLSSVMEITPAEGNKEKVKAGGGISPVMGRLMVEGPLEKIKGTFILGTRATYSDWVLKMLKDYQLSQSSANFYDIQGLIKSEINKKNNITLSGYISNDKFNYYREYVYDYRSLAFTLKWAHSFSQRFSAQFYAIISNYSYSLDSNQDSTLYSTMNYKIDQKILRAEFLYFHSLKHKIEFGTDATFYSLMPGVMEPVGDYSIVIPKRLEQERAVEPSLYISDEYEVSPLLSVSAGVRATLFTSFGPGTELQYHEGFSRSVESISGTISFKSGEVMKIYPGLEYRFSSRLIIAPNVSLKMGVQRVYQYIHMISNTTSMSPTDIWKLSDTYIRPERSDQISFGFTTSSEEGL